MHTFPLLIPGEFSADRPGKHPPGIEFFNVDKNLENPAGLGHPGSRNPN
jgi:hypothetical protein